MEERESEREGDRERERERISQTVKNKSDVWIHLGNVFIEKND